MSTEMTQFIASLQKELTISKLETEIAELKYQLQLAQTKKISRLEDSLYSPHLYDHYQKVALALSKSGMIPNQYKNKPEDIFVAMAQGYQLGFPIEQSLQDIAIINGRPCLWGDGLLALALGHSECENIQEEPIYQGSEVFGYKCTVIRKGHNPHVKEFTLKDAEKAGLVGKQGVWKSYPTRMLQMRARSLAIRDKFADALRGIRLAEVEKEDSIIIDGEILEKNISSNNKTQTERLKEVLSINEKEKNNEEDIEINQEEEPKETYYSGRDDEPISTEMLNTIIDEMDNKNFSEERRNKVLAYYKVDSFSDLSDAQARLFLLQLGKA